MNIAHSTCSSPGSSPGTAAPMRRDQLLLQMSVSSLILDLALYSHVGYTRTMSP